MITTEEFHNRSHLFALEGGEQRGKVWLDTLHHGMEYKHACLQTLADTCRQSVYLTPDLRLIITLEGRTHLKVGNRHFCIQTASSGMLLPVAELEVAEKIFYRERQNELVLLFSRFWLEDWCSSRPKLRETLLNTHLNPYPFRLTPSLQRQVARLLETRNLAPVWRPLYQEAQSIALLAEVLALLFPDAAIEKSSANPARKRSRRLAEMLRDPAYDRYTLTELARACHSNATTLQCDFTAEYGQTIAQYRRAHKLQLAREALRQGSDAATAAEISGYTNMQSFVRAFKKQFGSSPKVEAFAKPRI